MCRVRKNVEESSRVRGGKHRLYQDGRSYARSLKFEKFINISKKYYTGPSSKDTYSLKSIYFHD